MKKVNANEMRVVEGGVRYRASCGFSFTDASPWKIFKGLAHKSFCSSCTAAKKLYGYWYTFDSKQALALAPWWK